MSSLHELVAAHRQQILEACQKAIRDELGSEQVTRYSEVFFDEVLRFIESNLNRVDPSDGARSENGSAVDASEADALTLIGSGTPMRRARVALDQLARRSRAAVLLVGEFGTGKRHCARALHAATFPEGEFFELTGDRAAELESRIKALRSLASASAAAGLSIYVQELTELPAPLQLRLSQMLAEQGLHFRLMVASKRALAQAAREGLVRPELAFRFPNQIELPPLRDRPEDIADLAKHFAQLAAARRGTSATLLGQSAIERMSEYAWPGNLVELSNFMEQLAQNHGSALVEADDLPALDERPSGVNFHLPVSGIDFAELERELLTQALAMAGNNQTRAASLLGLSRDQLRYRLAKFDIPSSSAQS